MLAIFILLLLVLAISVVTVRELWRKVQKLEQALLRAENPYSANAVMSTMVREPSPEPPAQPTPVGR